MMIRKRISTFFTTAGIILSVTVASAQISPGELANAHAHLEGLSNCTQCHILGEKVSNGKCLACHTELKARVDQKKGYHASREVAGKNCYSCHSDHHGRNFQLVRFSKENFDHNLTGFSLTGAHTKRQCADCHKTGFIQDRTIKTKKFTYLGLNAGCNTCHTDYHQGTLKRACSDCHGNDAFKPAVKFSHATAAFQLTGRHKDVACAQCHRITTREGKKFQEFAGLRFNTCTGCHTDPHKNQFGQVCSDCHTSESFHVVKGLGQFDHSKTAFPLEDKHKMVTCKSCHKASLTAPIRHKQCTDCHADYHDGQFTRQGEPGNCAGCHTTKGFAGSSFTIERHDSTAFRLTGAHLATPCFACHKKQVKWNFRNIGTRCADCHTDVHAPAIDPSYYPGASCESCHNTGTWSRVTFDHAQTAFPLSGAHTAPTCRSCHFRKDADGRQYQKFTGLTTDCATCHPDIHYGQFSVNGVTGCQRCHQTGQWKMTAFDHGRTTFPLEGKHAGVACAKCHKPVTVDQDTFILYKLKDTRCEACH